MLDGFHGPEGQRAQEEEVGHGEVQQVHIRHGFQTVAHGGVDPDHQQVPDSTEDEDEPEERGFVLAAEGHDRATLAHARVLSWPVVFIVGRILQIRYREKKTHQMKKMEE